jgi:hypothetical protein
MVILLVFAVWEKHKIIFLLTTAFIIIYLLPIPDKAKIWLYVLCLGPIVIMYTWTLVIHLIIRGRTGRDLKKGGIYDLRSN